MSPQPEKTLCSAKTFPERGSDVTDPALSLSNLRRHAQGTAFPPVCLSASEITVCPVAMETGKRSRRLSGIQAKEVDGRTDQADK